MQEKRKFALSVIPLGMFLFDLLETGLYLTIVFWLYCNLWFW